MSLLNDGMTYIFLQAILEHLTCSLGILAHSKQRRLRTARVLNFGNQKEFWMYTCSFVHSVIQSIYLSIYH